MKPSFSLLGILSLFYRNVALSSMALTTATGALLCGTSTHLYAEEGDAAIIDVTLTEGDKVEYSTPTEIGDLSLSSGNTLTNAAGNTLTVSGAITTTSNDSTASTNIVNNGIMNWTGDDIVIDNYNIITNGNDAQLTISVSELQIKANGQLVNNGGTVTITQDLKLTYGCYITNTGDGVLSVEGTVTTSNATPTITNTGSGHIDFNTLTLSKNVTLTNSGAGYIDINTATISTASTITNSDSGYISFGSATVSGGASFTNSSSGYLNFNYLSLAGSASITNSSSGEVYIGSGSISKTVTNGSSSATEGTLYLGSSLTDTSLSSAASLTLASGSSITNYGTLNLDGTIIIGAENLITNYGVIETGDDLTFDISALLSVTTGTVTLNLINDQTSDDYVSTDWSSLDISNLTGFNVDEKFITDVTFSDSGSVTFTYSYVPTYNGGAQDISLSTLTLSDGATFDTSTDTALIITPADGATSTTTTALTIDTGETHLDSLTIEGSYNLTLSTEDADDSLSIGSLVLSSGTALTLLSDDISFDALSASSGATITFGGTAQNYTINLSDYEQLSSGNTLTAGNTLTLVDDREDRSETTKFTLGLTVYAGATAETATTFALATGGNLTINSSSFTFKNDGYVNFDIGAGATLINYKLMYVNNQNITFTKTGAGDLIIDYKMDSATNSSLIINEGTVSIGNSSTDFAKITINSGTTLSTYDSGATWNNLAQAIEMNGGTLQDGYGTSSSGITGNTTADFTLTLTSGDNTLNFSKSELSSLTFSESIQGGSNTEDGNLTILGTTGLSLTFSSIENLNATINNSDGKSTVNLETISNEAGQTTEFVGAFNATNLVKTGDGDLSFETLAVSESISVSGTGELSFSESLSVGTVTFSTNSSSSVSPVALFSSASNSTDNLITISYTGGEGSGTLSSDTLKEIRISNATVSSEADITLDTVSLSNVNIVAANSTVTLSNMSTVSESSITAAELIISVSEGSGLEIIELSDGSLSYIVTALDGFTEADISGDITLALNLDEVQITELSTALADNKNVSITINSTLIESMESTDNVSISIDNDAYTLDLAGNGQTASGDSFTVNVDVIPEPSTATLSLLALAGLLARRRRSISQ